MVKTYKFDFEFYKNKNSRFITFRDINKSKIKDLKVNKPKTALDGKLTKEDIENYNKTISFDIFEVLKKVITSFNYHNKSKHRFSFPLEPKDIESFNKSVKKTKVFNLIKRLKEEGLKIGYFVKPRIDSDIKYEKSRIRGDFENFKIFGCIKDNSFRILDEEFENKHYSYISDRILDFSKNTEEKDKTFILNIIKLNLLTAPFDEDVLDILLPDSMEIVFGKPSCKLIIDKDCILYDKADDLGFEISNFLLSKYTYRSELYESVKGEPKKLNKNIYIGVDFDGVIHMHNDGFKKSGDLNYEPNNSVIEFLQKLSKNNGIKIVIFTMRAYNKKYKKQVEKYLKKYKVPFYEISHQFNNFEFLLDDRCMRLEEEFDEFSNFNVEKLVKEIKEFEPWHKQDVFGDTTK